jgi:alkylhydroperoxidase family enzyme
MDAPCLAMHSPDARRQGETEQRLYLLNAWQESPLYSPRERAAFAWTEAVTRIIETHAPEAVYEETGGLFGERSWAIYRANRHDQSMESAVDCFRSQHSVETA